MATMHEPGFSEPSFGPIPILLGPPDLVEAYYWLESIERSQGMLALSRHAEEAGIWYRALTLHASAFLRGFNFTCPPEELRAHGLRMQLLGLGLTSSKAALDLLVRGYYSIAYAAIRHMAESWLFCRFIEGYPEQAAAFYRAEPGEPRSSSRPTAKTVVAKLKRRFPEKRDRELFERVYRTWDTMSEGSHPSGIGINQVRGDEDGRGILGATYRADMAQDGFNNGLPTALFLVHEVGRLQPQGNDWEDQVRSLMTHYYNLRAAMDANNDEGPGKQ